MVKVEVTQDRYAGTQAKVACKSCARDTNHAVLKSIEESGTEQISWDIEFHWATTYQIIQCQGCDTISFRSVGSNSEDTDVEGEPIDQEDLYPSRIVGREGLANAHILPTDLERIYRETITALNNNQPVLCGIGIRAIIEAVSKEKKAKGRDLFAKIDSLVNAGVLTRDGADILHKLRVLGNKAAHEVKVHSAPELDLAIDVVEHLLNAVYILPVLAKRTFS